MHAVMTHICRVLVPVDFGMPSRVAYRSAVGLTEGVDAEIHILHVAVHAGAADSGWTPHHDVTGFASASHEEHAESDVLELLEGVSQAACCRTQVYVTHGDRVGRILARARRGYDLVVMGSRGKRPTLPTQSSELSPVTRTVAENAPCPVLVVWEDGSSQLTGTSLERARSPSAEIDDDAYDVNVGRVRAALMAHAKGMDSTQPQRT